MCSNFFFSENLAVYEITWKNVVYPDRPQMAMWYMPAGYPRLQITHKEYVMPFALPRQQWLHERASMLRSTYIACLVEFYEHKLNASQYIVCSTVLFVGNLV